MATLLGSIAHGALFSDWTLRVVALRQEWKEKKIYYEDLITRSPEFTASVICTAMTLPVRVRLVYMATVNVVVAAPTTVVLD